MVTQKSILSLIIGIIVLTTFLMLSFFNANLFMFELLISSMILLFIFILKWITQKQLVGVKR